MTETETVTLMHTCAGGGCGKPLGLSHRQHAWVHEDGTPGCGAGLGVLEEPQRDVQVPVPPWVLIAEAHDQH